MKMNKPEYEDKVRICDICDVELMRDEIKYEIHEELAKLQDSISIARENYEKVEIERLDKSELVAKLEEELTLTERLQRKQEEDMITKLNTVINRGVKASGTVDDIKKELDISHLAESEMNSKRIENEEKIDRLKEDILDLKEKKIELMAQLEHLYNKLKGSLEIDQVLPLLCDKCKGRMKVNNTPVDSISWSNQGAGDSYLSNASS